MIETADVVVMGGGIMGASATHFLSKVDLGNVALLEKAQIAGSTPTIDILRLHYTRFENGSTFHSTWRAGNRA